MTPQHPCRDVAPTADADAKALLDGCFEQFRAKLAEIGRASVEMSGDLLAGNGFVEEKDVDEFKGKRTAWVERFDAALRELYARRMGACTAMAAAPISMRRSRRCACSQPSTRRSSRRRSQPGDAVGATPSEPSSKVA